jgi:hypothetical protein
MAKQKKVEETPGAETTTETSPVNQVLEEILLEAEQLAAKIESIDQFLENYQESIEIAGKEQRDLIATQAAHMHSYLDTLNIRIRLLS